MYVCFLFFFSVVAAIRAYAVAHFSYETQPHHRKKYFPGFAHIYNYSFGARCVLIYSHRQHSHTVAHGQLSTYSKHSHLCKKKKFPVLFI